MGWNIVRPIRHNLLLPMEEEEQRFYFVHSYHMVCDDPAHVVATTTHGGDIVSAVGRDRIWGVQFHPEKSHRYGKSLLQRFAGVGALDA
jgi:glutamine amidotransferase